MDLMKESIIMYGIFTFSSKLSYFSLILYIFSLNCLFLLLIRLSLVLLMMLDSVKLLQ